MAAQRIGLLFVLGSALMLLAGAAEPAENLEAATAMGAAQSANLRAAAGNCSAADAAQMRKAHSFPKLVADCGRRAYKWFRFHQDKMEQCIRDKASLSGTCSKCFSAGGVYGYKHCKVQCLFGSWCSDRCLGCTSKNDLVVQACVGVSVPPPKKC